MPSCKRTPVVYFKTWMVSLFETIHVPFPVIAR